MQNLNAGTIFIIMRPPLPVIHGLNKPLFEFGQLTIRDTNVPFLKYDYPIRVHHNLTPGEWQAVSRCPMSRHHTVSARHRTLLVYEGYQSHVIKNMAARVKFSSPLKGTFCSISPPRGILQVRRYVYSMQLCTKLFIRIIPFLKLL